MAEKARVTASMSALTKFTVTGACDRCRVPCAQPGAWASVQTSVASSASVALRQPVLCGRFMFIRSI